MGFTDNRITDEEIAGKGVQSQPNKLVGTAAQNKAVFDRLITEVVKTRLNGLIDALLDANAAGEIGVDTITGLEAGTVQEALEGIMQAMQDITQGSVADGAITTAKLDSALMPRIRRIFYGVLPAEEYFAAEGLTAENGDIYLRLPEV